jgi:cellobiose-specific phosphotransferase system component IIC
MNSLTLGLMGLYCSLTIAQAYAEKLGVDVKSAGLLGLAVFIITTGTDGVDVNNWSASGLFVAIVTVSSFRAGLFLCAAQPRAVYQLTT